MIPGDRKQAMKGRVMAVALAMLASRRVIRASAGRH